MTPERQNEIWAMLDADTQEWIKGQYEEILEDIADYKAQNTESDFLILENRAIGQKKMLMSLFGKHNLTAQTEEKPKEQKKGLIDKMYDLLDKYNTDTPFKDKPSRENSLDVTKSDMDAGHFDTVSFQYNLDYQQYRLDLAKEIAMAMIPDGWNMEIANRVVGLANEIVKRLKETDNAD